MYKSGHCVQSPKTCPRLAFQQLGSGSGTAPGPGAAQTKRRTPGAAGRSLPSPLCPLPPRAAPAAAPRGAARGNGDKAEANPSPRHVPLPAAERNRPNAQKQLPKAAPRPGAGKDGAGCQRRRCGGTGRPAQPFVVCAAADKKGEEYTPRTHTQTHTPRVPAPPAHRSVLQLGRCAQRSLGRRGPRSPGRGGGRRRMSAMGGRKGGRKRVFWGERGPERGREGEKEASQHRGAPSGSRKALAGPRCRRRRSGR